MVCSRRPRCEPPARRGASVAGPLGRDAAARGRNVVLEQTDRGRVVYLRVPRPASLGTASTRLAGARGAACLAIAGGPAPPVAVALVGAGDAYCARSPRDAADCDAATPAWAEATAAVARLAPPTVAAMGGDALGPAWELALACDLRLAAATAHVGSPGIPWGRLPAARGPPRPTPPGRPAA